MPPRRLGRLRVAASVRDVQHAVAAEYDRAAAAAFTHEDVPRAGEPFAVPRRPRDGQRRLLPGATTTSSRRGSGWLRGAGAVAQHQDHLVLPRAAGGAAPRWRSTSPPRPAAGRPVARVGARARWRGERLGVADIDDAVAFEVRVQRQVRAGQPRPGGHRRAGHRLRIDHTVSHRLDGAAAFGHEDRVVRHEGHAPRILEAARVDAHTNGLPLTGLVSHRCGGQWRNLDAWRRRGRTAAAHGHVLLGRQRHDEGRNHSGGEKSDESVHASSPRGMTVAGDESNGQGLCPETEEEIFSASKRARCGRHGRQSSRSNRSANAFRLRLRRSHES